MQYLIPYYIAIAESTKDAAVDRESMRNDDSEGRQSELAGLQEFERIVEHEAAPAADAVLSEPNAGETTIHRFRLSPELGSTFDVEALQTAEFWLNAADGDLGAALLLASERLNLAATTASRGFLRGRRLNTATGL